MKLSSERFAEDFDNELTIIYKNFKQPALLTGDHLAKNLAAAMDMVNQQARFPDLIKKIYVVNINPDQDLNISGFFRSDTSLVPQQWPEDFLFLKKKFESSPYLETLIALCHGPTLGETPFIVIHLIPGSLINLSRHQNDSFLIIELDKNILVNQFLPQLTNQYFSVDGEPVYQVGIFRESTSENVFFRSSNKDKNYFLENPVYTLDIGNWRTDKFMVAATKIVMTDTIKSQNSRTLKIQTNNRISIEMIENDAKQVKDSFNFLISNITPWRLYVKHSGGDLESVISRSRTQNLLVSYIIILLLGVSVSLLFSSFKKSQKMTRQQIEFVAGLTHELRTPLASIRSAAENIKDGIIKSPDQLKKYARLIYDEDVRLTKMIEQSLQLTGLTNGVEKVRKDVSLKDLFDEILDEIDRDARNLINLKAEKSPVVSADPIGLKIVIRNLLSNALKYNQNHEMIETGYYFEPKKAQHILYFRDNGPGIDEEDLPFIFDPFFRGRNARESLVQGSGIGLSLVRKIVDDHNGRIEVKNGPGRGCTFLVSIPNEAKAEQNG